MAIKENLHPKNAHREGYDFDRLIEKHQALSPFVAKNKYGNLSINFFDPLAVKALNTALLKAYYDIENFELPDGYLCPAVPGRAEYIHRVADLIEGAATPMNCLDIGAGANLVYPIIASHVYQWNFVAIDTDQQAIECASKIIENNPRLADKVVLRQQTNRKSIFKQVVKEEDRFTLSICNPPFYSSAKEASVATRRKVNNLTKNRRGKLVRNFGGASNELWCEGGELGFLKRMILESKMFKQQIKLFTSLVSKESNLPQLKNELNKVDAKSVQVIQMKMGNKQSHLLAWSF